MRLATSHSNMHGLVPLNPAVEGLDLEKISIEANFVPKEVEFFVEQHIQMQLKSTLVKISYWQLNFINFFLQYIMFDIICHTQDDPIPVEVLDLLDTDSSDSGSSGEEGDDI